MPVGALAFATKSDGAVDTEREMARAGSWATRCKKSSISI